MNDAATPAANDPNAQCTLNGSSLFLIDSIASDPQFTHSISVPDGYTNPTLAVPKPSSGELYLHLRDDPAIANTITVPPNAATLSKNTRRRRDGGRTAARTRRAQSAEGESAAIGFTCRDDLWHRGIPMKLSRISRSVFFPALLLISLTASAELRLPKLWSDHGVIQRDRPIHVWGWGDVGARVTRNAARRHWRRRRDGKRDDRLAGTLEPLSSTAAGGRRTLHADCSEANGGDTITRHDLLMGDVWLASGQSNMEMPLSGFPGSAVLKNGAGGDQSGEPSGDPAAA